MRHLRLALIAAVAASFGLALAVSGCKHKQAGSVLSFIPADTPYVIANIEPIPKGYVDSLAAKFAPLAASYEQLIDEALAKLATEDQKEISNRIATAILQELKGKISVAGFESLGLTMQAHSAIYGVGLAPVLRVELKDPEAFKAFLARVEKRVGEALPTAKIADQVFWRFGRLDSPLVGLMILQGNHLVLAAIPKDASVGLVKQLFGVTPPAKSMADSGQLEALNKKFGFVAQGSGYLDTQRFAQAVLDAKSGVEKEYVHALGGKEDAASPECRQEMLAIAANFPRAVLGYTRMEPNAMDMRMVLETKPALAKSMAELVAPVPGLGQGSEALIDFGMSLNVGKLVDFVGAQARAVAAAPYKCAELTELNKSFAKVQADLSNPMAFAAAPVLKGFHIALTKYEMAPGTMPQIAGKIAIASDNPQTLVGMAQSFMPQLKDLKLSAGAAPVRLPEGLAPPGVPPAYLALNDKALGLAIGEGEQTNLTSFIGAAPANPPPALVLSYGGKFFELMAANTLQAAQSGSDEQRAKMEHSMTLMRDVYGKLLKRTDMAILFTDSGIELRQSMVLN